MFFYVFNQEVANDPLQCVSRQVLTGELLEAWQKRDVFLRAGGHLVQPVENRLHIHPYTGEHTITKYYRTVHAKDKKLLQDTRSCNGAIIAGPDQSLPAQIEFRSKFT